jgi:hypothetical protein
MGEFFISYQEVTIIAGPNVSHCILEMFSAANTANRLRGQATTESTQKLADAFSALTKAMRDELLVSDQGELSQVADDAVSRAGMMQAIQRRLNRQQNDDGA